MKIKVLSAPEVAYVLRQQLGPIRAWEFTLADMRRNRVESVYGASLMPICVGKYESAWRPMYAAADVLKFIQAVRIANSCSGRHLPYQVKTAHLDPSDTRPWDMRKLPVAKSTFATMMGRSTRMPGYLPV